MRREYYLDALTYQDGFIDTLRRLAPFQEKNFINTEKKMLLHPGKKYVYTERNSVFEITSMPNDTTQYYTVYYPATGEYRRYNEQKILANCRPFTEPPKRKKYVAPITIFLPGFPYNVQVFQDGSITAGCHKSKPGAVKIFLAALKKGKK